MATERIPDEEEDGTYHDDEADLKVASEELISAADTAVVTIRETRYLRMNVAVGLLAVIAIVAGTLSGARLLRAIADRDPRELYAEPGGGVAEEMLHTARCGSGIGIGRAGRRHILDRILVER